MSDKSGIEWTESTWNPITGCTQISEGCANCYAKREAETRLRGRCGYPQEDPFKVTFQESRLDQPLRWTKSRKIFVCSMGDLFHEDVPVEWINEVFRVIQQAPAHRFMILTKRPERMRDYFRRVLEVRSWPEDDVPFSNVWAGVTAENQARADERIPVLLDTPATKRFVSVEPMLGPITFRWRKWQPWRFFDKQVTDHLDALRRFDWIICGGETGKEARPMHPDWVRSLRDQCHEAGTPFFFKSWGDWGEIQSAVSYRAKGHSESVVYFPENECDLSRDRGIREAIKGSHGATMARMGKRAAGRLLDGRTWDEEPEVA